MPTLEFHGYDAHAAHASYLEIVEVVRTLAYADEIVFDLPRESGSRVLDMSGRSRPFVRVHSRSRERAEELVERIARFCDVEAASLTHFKQETAMDMTTQPQFLTETEIVRGIAPIRQFGLAIVLHQVFSSPLDDLLAQGSTLTAAEAASASALVPERVEAVLIFLANEGYMRREGASFQPNAEYLRARRCKGWYTMFVGGYSPTLLGLGAGVDGDVIRQARRTSLHRSAWWTRKAGTQRLESSRARALMMPRRPRGFQCEPGCLTRS